MHVLDGHLPQATLAIGFATTAVLTAATLPRLREVSPSRVAMVTSVFFVASLLRMPTFAATSVHLSLIGLAGVILGRAAFPSVLVGVVLQLALFSHGGLTTIGVNVATMGGGALVAAAVFHVGECKRPVLRAALAGAAGTTFALVLFGFALLSAGEALEKVAWASLALHAPVLVVETVMTAAIVSFLARVQPDLLGLPPLGEPGEASE